MFFPDTNDLRRAPRGRKRKLGTIPDVATDIKMNGDCITNADSPDFIVAVVFRRLCELRRVVIVRWVDMKLGVVTPGRCDVHVKWRRGRPSLVAIVHLLVATLVAVHFFLVTLIIMIGWAAYFACCRLRRQHFSSFGSLSSGSVAMVMIDVGLHILLQISNVGSSGHTVRLDLD